MKPCDCSFCNRTNDAWAVDIWPAYLEIIQTFARRYSVLSWGKDRVVFEHKNFVVKIPRHDWGYLANLREYDLYKVHGKERGYARCRMWGDLLIMERVKCARKSNALPPWADKIDNQQVGYDSKGRLVAYDYGG